MHSVSYLVHVCVSGFVGQSQACKFRSHLHFHLFIC